MNFLQSLSDEPLLTVTFGQLLDQAAVSWPDKEAYVFPQTGSRVTFAGLKDQVDSLAGGLQSLGISRGDHVGWVLANRAEWVVLFLAAMKIGAVAVPLDLCFFQYAEGTVVNILNKAGVKLLVVEAGQDESTSFHGMFDAAKRAERGTPAAERLPHLATLVTIGESRHRECYTLAEILHLGEDAQVQERLAGLQDQPSCRDPAMLLLTSGTTGLSKLVQQTTQAILNSNRFVALALHMDQQCKAVFGTLFCNLAWSFFPPLITGCTFVVPSTREPEATDFLSAIQDEKCDMIYCLYVKNFHSICHCPNLSDFDLSSLKQVMTGGNMVSTKLITTAATVLPHVTVTNSYGSTETMYVAGTVPEMPSEARNTTVGTVLPHLPLKIADDQGNSVPCNTIGEVLVKGYSLFLQYHGDVAKTAAAKTKDGWFRMGDMGFIGEDGLVRLTGRKREMIIKDSENIYPGMIEGPLLEHPAVKDVKVVGVPDAACGEELCACIILKSGESVDEEDMKQFANDTGLVEEYCPEYILFMKSFPMTANGRKVDRKKLRDVAVELLGLKDLN